MKTQHFIDIPDHEADWLNHVLEVATTLRQSREAGRLETMLAGKSLVMLSEKPSLRTRVSFQQAMLELGGHAIVLQQQEVGLGQRESVADFTRVLNGMVHGIAARVFEHEKLTEMAAYATGPVINALSDRSHPCQAMADVLTMHDEFGPDLSGRTVAFVGDGNNVACSLAQLCAKLGIRFVLAAPEGFKLDGSVYKEIRRQCPDALLEVTDHPHEAVRQADAIYADTFVSMGQEDEKAARLETFAPYQINAKLLASAPDHAIVLHCLPAYRGIEITDDVMDGPQSRVFPQAHNRLHAQKGLLAVLLGNA
ncbi:MAG: ornithine carbamoyltransferase [Phycisphaeraceae bacterium]